MSGMSLSGIRYIYAARLQARAVLVQEVFAILGIAVGVALLFASQVSSTSLAQSIAQLTSQFVGSAQVQLEARSPEGFPESLLGEVRRIPGVRVAMPVSQQQVNVIGSRGERSVDLVGVDPRTVGASGQLLRRFSAKQLSRFQAVALPSPLAAEIGEGALQPVKLQVGARYVTTLLGATLAKSDIGELVHSPIAVTSLGYAQRLAGTPGQISRIFVRYDPSYASEVRSALAQVASSAHVNLVPGTLDARLFAIAVAPESTSEGLFSGISALVGFMFALNAMLITVPARRKMIEDVRPHGATRWMTVQILLFDAAVLGVIACVLGLALGDVLSVAVFHAAPGYLTFAFPIGNNRIVTWQCIVLAVATGMIAAIIGVLWPVRDILARPLQAPVSMDERQSRQRRVWLGVGVLGLALTTVTLLFDTKAALFGNVALVIALVCLLPFAFDGVVWLFDRGSDFLNGIGMALAVTELQTTQTRVRSLAIAATAAVAVFGIVEFNGTQQALRRGLDASAYGLDSGANVWVTPRGRSSLLTTIAFEPTDLARLSHIRGVSSVGVYGGNFLDWGERRLWVIAPAVNALHMVPASQLIDGDLALAATRMRAGGWALLSQALVSERHLRIGRAFTLPSPQPQRLRLAGVITNLGWPPGAVVLNSSDYVRGWPSGDPSAYEIEAAAGVPTSTLRNLVQRVLGREDGLAVESAAEREHRHYVLAAQGLSRVTQIKILILVAAVLAVVGAMASMIWQRRDRLAFSKCNGFRQYVLWRSLLCESAVLIIAGCAIGSIFGVYGQVLGSHFLASATGFPVVFHVDGISAVSSFVLVTAIAVSMLAVPGYLAVRVRPTAVGPVY